VRERDARVGRGGEHGADRATTDRFASAHRASAGEVTARTDAIDETYKTAFVDLVFHPYGRVASVVRV
jgi:hypothetical protein